MSTETLPLEDVAVGLSTIEGIDLDLEVKCDDPVPDHQHDHRADAITAFHCLDCGRRNVRPRCWAAIQAHRLRGTYCLGCEGDDNDGLVIVEVLR